MKLGELKNLIRHRKGNPCVFVSLGQGKDRVSVTVQKTSLLKALDNTFPDGRNAETNLCLREDGALIEEGAPSVSRTGTSPEVEIDDLDDLGEPDIELEELDEL